MLSWRSCPVGLLHISQIAEERVNSVSDYLKEGQVVRVKCLDVDQRGRIKLSIKEAQRDENPQQEPAAPAEGSVADAEGSDSKAEGSANQ